jgi:hypothetical protein
MGEWHYVVVLIEEKKSVKFPKKAEKSVLAGLAGMV